MGEVAFISRWFGGKIKRQANDLHNTTTNEFIQNCEKMSVKCSDSSDGKYYKLTNGRKGVKISKKHRTLQGAVQRSLLKDLGLSRGKTGMRFAKFQEGQDQNSDTIRRLIRVLRLLAAYDREQEEQL